MNQEKQPEALRLADLLENSWAGIINTSKVAATELRRLHTDNERLTSAVFLLCESFTLPHDVRKVLETALYST